MSATLPSSVPRWYGKKVRKMIAKTHGMFMLIDAELEARIQRVLEWLNGPEGAYCRDGWCAGSRTSATKKSFCTTAVLTTLATFEEEIEESRR